jgi:hypothetical protein
VTYSKNRKQEKEQGKKNIEHRKNNKKERQI